MLIATLGNSQSLKEIKDYKFENGEDYQSAEKLVLECAEFILSNPVNSDPEKRIIFGQFILKWMEGCKYTFELGKDFVKYSKGDVNKTGVYLSAMAKERVNMKAEDYSVDELNKRTSKLFKKYKKEFGF